MASFVKKGVEILKLQRETVASTKENMLKYVNTDAAKLEEAVKNIPLATDINSPEAYQTFMNQMKAKEVPAVQKTADRVKN